MDEKKDNGIPPTYISKNTIDKIFQAVKIEDVIKDSVKLKQKGANYTGLCPFHDEKTPSFMVFPVSNHYHCFGCGAHGNAVGFLMKMEKLSYPSALKKLAGKYNITLKEEKASPEQEKIQKQRQALTLFYLFMANFYKENLYKAENALALEYTKSRFSNETMEKFQIGYAPNQYDGLAKFARSAGYKEEFLLSTGFIRQNKHTHQLYDFFRNRIMFPITDSTGNIISFSGRALPGDEKKYGKYINGTDTPVFNKRLNLFALNFALRQTAKTGTAYLVEGNPDVLRLHEIGIINSVAPLGTALSDEQISLLKRYATKIVMIYDGDNAGQKAREKNGKKLVKAQLPAYSVTLPKKEDPDSFFISKVKFDEYIEENKKDFLLEYANTLLVKAGTDPLQKNEAVKEIGNLLFSLEKSKQSIYVDQICNAGKIKNKLFSDFLRDKQRTEKPSKATEPKKAIPAGVDPNEIEKWGFYADNNEYLFRTKDGFQKLSNFVMRPIFHVDSVIDSKRIYELENVYGYKTVIDFDMQEMTSIQAFQRNIEGKGNFIFWGTIAHFQKLKRKLYQETRTCQEIKNLGWQKEGFWAWSNGKTTDEGRFEEIDEYGIITHKNINYFIPAFSKIYLGDRSLFIDERKFKYVNRDLSLQKWAKMFINVFGDNAKISIAFWVATVFRDYLLYTFKNFPILNLFGPKGTGKSQLAMSMSCLFGEQQTPFNIHNGTKPGLAEHLQLFRNAFAGVEEYKNNLEYDKIETLKSIYDAVGRSRLNMNKGMKKETTQVNAGVILSGQEMPTIDVALFSRVIFLQFHKTEFNEAEKKYYDLLKQAERDGLSHLTAQLLKYRKYFEENFYGHYEKVVTEFYEDNKKLNLEDRILRNMATVVASFKTLAEKIDFTFNYSELKPAAYKAMRDQNNQISLSSEVGMFWNLLEALFDDNLIIDRWHFRIDLNNTLKLKDRQLNLKPARRVLKFKFNVIYKLYAQQSRNQGIKPLPSDTLQYYLRNSKNFYGIQDKTNFSISEYDKEKGKTIKRKQNTTAFCFNYEQLGINLERDDEETEAVSEINSKVKESSSGEPKYAMAEKDDIPF
jgi:DNA primase catalytic core